MKNCLVSEKDRYEEVKNLAPILQFHKFPFLPYMSTFHHYFPFPFPSLHYRFILLLLPYLPSFSLTYLPCSFPYILPSIPISFPPYLSTFLPTYSLPLLPIFFPTCPLPSIPTIPLYFHFFPFSFSFPFSFPSPPLRSLI